MLAKREAIDYERMLSKRPARLKRDVMASNKMVIGDMMADGTEEATRS
jgi:hypothetical protein